MSDLNRESSYLCVSSSSRTTEKRAPRDGPVPGNPRLTHIVIGNTSAAAEVPHGISARIAHTTSLSPGSGLTAPSNSIKNRGLIIKQANQTSPAGHSALRERAAIVS